MTSQATTPPLKQPESAHGPSWGIRLMTSILAVLGGYAASIIYGLIRAGVLGAARLLDGAPSGVPGADRLLGTATLWLGFAIGGYVTAAIAGRREGRHAVALGAFGFIRNVAELAPYMHKIPELLSILSMAIHIPFVLAGGLFRSWEKRRGFGGAPTSFGDVGSLMLLSSFSFLGLSTANPQDPSPLALAISAPTFIGSCFAFGGRFRKLVLATLLLGVVTVIVTWILAWGFTIFGGVGLILNGVAIWAVSKRARDPR